MKTPSENKSPLFRLLYPVHDASKNKVIRNVGNRSFPTRVGGPLSVLNGTKLILDDQGNHLDSFIISLESFRSFRGPLFRKPVTGQELFLLLLTANRL